jgi:Flp pilus assembly protein TadB
VSWSLAGGLGAIFVALFILAVTVFGSLARAGQQRDLAGRIASYGPRHGTSQMNDEQGAGQKAGSVALDATKRLMSPEAQQRLTGSVIIGVLVGALAGWLGMRMLLSFLIRRRRRAFADQLPDLLQLLASSLRSGFSLLQALDAVVREAGQPAGGEFGRALAEGRLGADLEDCLETIADRMGSEDLRWTVMAIRIQRGIGGNLAEVLSTTVTTIRERGYLRRQVQALSADGRLSAYILIALPVVIGGCLFLARRSYMRPLYTTHMGEVMLVGAIVLEAIGTALMRQIIKVEV